MRTIHKFEIPFQFAEADIVNIMMPAGSYPLSVGVQSGYPYLWALVSTDAHQTQYKLGMAFTGKECRFNGNRFLGTVQLPIGLYKYGAPGGTLVLHFFEVDQQ